MRRLKVVVVDDHKLMLDAVRASLECDEDIDVVAESRSAENLPAVVGQTGADVVLLDVRMPGIDGLAALEQLRARYPSVAVIMFSGIDDPTLVRAALERGAAAFVLKHVAPRDLAATVREVVNGSVFRPLDLRKTGTDAAAPSTPLSQREQSILAALESGGSNREIAASLFLAEQTVKFHLTNIYRKLGVSTRTEALCRAYEEGLLERPLSYVA